MFGWLSKSDKEEEVSHAPTVSPPRRPIFPSNTMEYEGALRMRTESCPGASEAYPPPPPPPLRDPELTEYYYRGGPPLWPSIKSLFRRLFRKKSKPTESPRIPGLPHPPTPMPPRPCCEADVRASLHAILHDPEEGEGSGTYEATVQGLPEEMKNSTPSPCNHLWYEITKGREVVDLNQRPGRIEFLIDKIRCALARDDQLDVVIMLNEGRYEVRIRF